MSTPAAPPEPEPSPERDPGLGRLRRLLRLQLEAAEAGAWANFQALAAAVRRELERQAGAVTERPALAEAAHLQVRLELLLQQRAQAMAERLGRADAGRAYRRLALPRR